MFNNNKAIIKNEGKKPDTTILQKKIIAKPFSDFLAYVSLSRERSATAALGELEAAVTACLLALSKPTQH